MLAGKKNYLLTYLLNYLTWSIHYQSLQRICLFLPSCHMYSMHVLWNFTPEILSPYWFFKVLSLPQDIALWSFDLFEVGLLRLKMGSKNKNSLRCAHFAGLYFVNLTQSRVIWDGSVLIEEPCPSDWPAGNSVGHFLD